MRKKQRKEFRREASGKQPKALRERFTYAKIESIRYRDRVDELRNVTRTYTHNYRSHELGILNVRYKITNKQGQAERYITGTSALGYAKGNSVRMFKEAQKSALAQYMREKTGANYATLLLEPVDYSHTYYDQIAETYKRTVKDKAHEKTKLHRLNK